MSTLQIQPRPDFSLRVLDDAPDDSPHPFTPPHCHTATSPLRDLRALRGDSPAYVTPARTAGDFLATETTREPASLDFDPGEQQAADILEQLVSPHCSLSSLAAAHGTSFQALTLWLTRPDIAARIDAVENVCARRVRVVAVNHLSHCVEVTSRILKYADWEESHVVYPPNSAKHNEQRRRTRETALRAARTLIQLANFTPGQRNSRGPKLTPRNSETPSPREGAGGGSAAAPNLSADAEPIPAAKARAQQESLEIARSLAEANSLLPRAGNRLAGDLIPDRRIPADRIHSDSALSQPAIQAQPGRPEPNGNHDSGEQRSIEARSPSPHGSPAVAGSSAAMPLSSADLPICCSAPPAPLACPHSPHKNPP